MYSLKVDLVSKVRQNVRATLFKDYAVNILGTDHFVASLRVRSAAAQLCAHKIIFSRKSNDKSSARDAASKSSAVVAADIAASASTTLLRAAPRAASSGTGAIRSASGRGTGAAGAGADEAP
jgi:hypothetical protein